MKINKYNVRVTFDVYVEARDAEEAEAYVEEELITDRARHLEMKTENEGEVTREYALCDIFYDEKRMGER